MNYVLLLLMLSLISSSSHALVVVRSTSTKPPQHSHYVTRRFARDTDDEYYLKLFEKETQKEKQQVVDEEQEELQWQRTEASERYQEHRQALREWKEQLVKLKQDGIQKRKQEREKKRICRLAEKALLQNQYKLSSSSEMISKGDYHTLLEVYKRLYEKLASMEKEASERAKEFLWERQKQQVSSNSATQSTLAADQSSNKDHHLVEIVQLRNEARQRKDALVRMVLSNKAPTQTEIEQLSVDDLLAVLTIRGNVKGVGRAKKRKAIVKLFLRSFEMDLF